MLNPEKFLKIVHDIIKVGNNLHKRIWTTSKSENYSVRLDDDHIAITTTGSYKGDLQLDDIILINPEGKPLYSSKKPSSDTIDHLGIYHSNPNIGSVLHFHSVNATIASDLADSIIRFENYEVLKAFQGITSFLSSRTE